MSETTRHMLYVSLVAGDVGIPGIPGDETFSIRCFVFKPLPRPPQYDFTDCDL